MSQATKRAWRRVAASLFLLPALAEGGNALYAQYSGGTYPASSANRSVDPKDEAQMLVKQGRVYLQANDIAKANQCAMQAQQKNVKWELYDDTPEQLLKDIAAISRAGVQNVSAVGPLTLPSTHTATTTKSRPRNFSL